MSKITLNGDAVVITSALKVSDIATAAKYNPQALSLREKNEDGKFEEVFRISVGENGGVSRYGITFSGTSRDGKGFATVTLPFTGSDDPKAAKDEIADAYGVAIAQLNKIEAALPAALDEIAAAKKLVVDAITVG